MHTFMVRSYVMWIVMITYENISYNLWTMHGRMNCELLNENLTCLHNSVCKINAIEEHWVKNVFYKNKFMQILIASIVSVKWNI